MQDVCAMQRACAVLTCAATTAPVLRGVRYYAALGCYALCGTKLRSAATRRAVLKHVWSYRRKTTCSHGAPPSLSKTSVLPHQSYRKSGTDLAYGATCPLRDVRSWHPEFGITAYALPASPRVKPRSPPATTLSAYARSTTCPVLTYCACSYQHDPPQPAHRGRAAAAKNGRAAIIRLGHGG
eukprot:1549567-Rhodomonas_salina.1